MKISDALFTLSDKKLNHRMIVHGIHGERVIVPVTLINFVCAIATDRNDHAFARRACKFPIKEVILNRYNKKLTDEQYSAILTLLVHCRQYGGLAIDSNIKVVYKSSHELKYLNTFKALLDSSVELDEAVYNLGFDTGEISLETADYNVAQDVLGFVTCCYVNTLPDEMFLDDSEYPDAEVMPVEDN